jgi:hypothetical protein
MTNRWWCICVLALWAVCSLGAQTVDTPGAVTDNLQGIPPPNANIPEPSTYLMLVTGAAGLGYLYHRRKRKAGAAAGEPSRNA